MPIEVTLLEGKPYPRVMRRHPVEPWGYCENEIQEEPNDEPFMRGMVHSWWRKKLGRPYCALICPRCEQIVGWEKP